MGSSPLFGRVGRSTVVVFGSFLVGRVGIEWFVSFLVGRVGRSSALPFGLSLVGRVVGRVG